jgi:hypothetical protein
VNGATTSVDALESTLQELRSSLGGVRPDEVQLLKRVVGGIRREVENARPSTERLKRGLSLRAGGADLMRHLSEPRSGDSADPQSPVDEQDAIDRAIVVGSAPPAPTAVPGAARATNHAGGTALRDIVAEAFEVSGRLPALPSIAPRPSPRGGFATAAHGRGASFHQQGASGSLPLPSPRKAGDASDVSSTSRNMWGMGGGWADPFKATLQATPAVVHPHHAPASARAAPANAESSTTPAPAATTSDRNSTKAPPRRPAPPAMAAAKESAFALTAARRILGRVRVETSTNGAATPRGVGGGGVGSNGVGVLSQSARGLPRPTLQNVPAVLASDDVALMLGDARSARVHGYYAASRK